MTSKVIDSDDGTVPAEIRHSRVIRQAAQRNLAEKLAQVEQQRHLETQRRYSQAQLEHDQKQLRAQLRRLQDEQRLLAEGEAADEADDSCFLDDDKIKPWHQDCVNPYPIVFPSTTRCRSSLGSTSGRRNDLDPTEDDTARGQGRSAVRSSSRCHGSVNTTPRSSISLSGPQVPCEFTHGEDALWAGDPEAIQSIRRPRKSVAQLKLEHKWNRSHSVKERAVTKQQTTKPKSICRSKSMREPPSVRHLIDPDSSTGLDSLSDSIGQLNVASRSRISSNQSEGSDTVTQS